jgi:hypothetical protein
MEVIKNPIVIGVLTGITTYAYLKYNVDKKNKILLSDDKDAELEEVNLMTPLLFTIIGWLFAISYFQDETNIMTENISNNKSNVIVTESNKPELLIGGTNNGNHLQREINNIVETMTTHSEKSYHVLSKGLNIPRELGKLPDVFIEN